MKRSREKEWMDLGRYTSSEYEDALYQLNRIGRYLGGNRATFWAFNQIETPCSILDVGCGGGFFTRLLAERYPHVMGCDISQEAISFAKRHPSSAKFLCTSQILPANVITATLVCHHMSDEALIRFLKETNAKAKSAVILNDLQRSRFALIGFWIISKLFFRNRMVQHDGLLSIRRSLTRKEWSHFLQAAEIPLDRCSITWHWAFRWIVLIRK